MPGSAARGMPWRLTVDLKVDGYIAHDRATAESMPAAPSPPHLASSKLDAYGE